MKKVIVIGKGPAGISAAIYTARANIETLVIGKGYGALETANVENYYGFPEPISGKDLIDRGVQQVKNLGAKVIEDEVVSVSFYKNDENNKPLYIVKTLNDEIVANAVVIAVGQERKRSPIKNLDMLEGQGVSYCAICDAFFYRGKDVCVIGAGKYALGEVNDLLPIAGSVSLLTNGKDPEIDFPENVKIYKEKIETMNPHDSSNTLESVSLVGGITLQFSGAFVAEGSASSMTLAKKLGLFTEKSKIMVSKKMDTNMPGIYAAGDCTGGLLQIAKAVGDGALAGISIAKYLR